MRGSDLLVAVVALVLGCGETTTTAESAAAPQETTDAATAPGSDAGSRFGAVGTRCRVAGDCATDLRCETTFFGERPVCTSACAASCPDGAHCLTGIPRYDDGLSGYVCLRPCEVTADCAPFGSECDAPEGFAGRRYCF